MFGAESMRKAQLLPLGKALMLVLKQPGDDIRAAALGEPTSGVAGSVCGAHSTPLDPPSHHGAYVGR